MKGLHEAGTGDAEEGGQRGRHSEAHLRTGRKACVSEGQSGSRRMLPGAGKRQAGSIKQGPGVHTQKFGLVIGIGGSHYSGFEAGERRDQICLFEH